MSGPLFPPPNESLNMADSATPMEPDITLTPGLSTVDYESQHAKEDSEYQVRWSSVMDKGNYKHPSTYQNVEVLLLRWADNSDDIATKEEVDKLKSVFHERYHYRTHMEYLNTNVGPGLQVQVNATVAVFVKNHDGPRTLLIVYYAGHGRPGSYYGALEIFGQQTSPNGNKQKIDSIVWNKTEELLKPAEADILEIFDCCHAGTLGLIRGEQRSFEYLAATREMAATRVPGKDSFTAALIHALESLLVEGAEGRFTTVELLNKIKEHSHFPADQMPVLTDREHIGPGGRIMLHPLSTASSGAQTPPKDEVEARDLAKRRTLTLHFDFARKPKLARVEAFGHHLNSIFERNSLGVNSVRWGGLKESMVFRAAQTFLGHRRTNAKRGHSTVVTDYSDECPTPSTAEPPTPSSSSQQSPRAHDAVVTGGSATDPSLLSPTSPVHRKGDRECYTQGRQKRRKTS